jgi:hypothetical protein
MRQELVVDEGLVGWLRFFGAKSSWDKLRHQQIKTDKNTLS